ncbi:hypothetical protein [Sphingobacterium sp.]|uniref:hypothetical protein n=1 Tax=Sphingobacterium sp. TaxID=341027 RepID=UPI0028B09BB9|nr:hypothetical protein [Sphingobacterium sp.]
MEKLDKEILKHLEKVGLELYNSKAEGQHYSQAKVYSDKEIDIFVAFDKTDNVDFEVDSTIDIKEVDKMHNSLKMNKLKEINDYVIYYYIVRKSVE